MKLIRSQKLDKTGRAHVFVLGPQEKITLLGLLKMYPMFDSSHHRISRKPKTASETDQEWLEEAMAQNRQDHKKKLAQFFSNDRTFFKEGKGHYHLTLTGEQMEWLLRVLNEIRVGSWVQLGRPELEAVRKMKLTSAQARLFTVMELSGYFESALLEAFA